MRGHIVGEAIELRFVDFPGELKEMIIIEDTLEEVYELNKLRRDHVIDKAEISMTEMHGDTCDIVRSSC